MKPEIPVGIAAEQGQAEWGSDAIAALLSQLGLRYIALNPGSSYRGLHDSLINFAGNVDPQMLICLHEEAAVAIAHGYAKVAGQPMAVALHSNVGLMHASMAVYNAFCDRVPMLLLGATGPVDATRRRPWIDWIHTSADQAAIIRPYTKWDDQPASVAAALDSIARAYSVTAESPSAPTYVCLDVSLQEEKLGSAVPQPAVRRDRSHRRHGPDSATTSEVLAALERAERPLFLIGRVSRNKDDWERRIALAERHGALVLTDLKVGAAFPSHHRLHPHPPNNFLAGPAMDLLGEADLIVSLDWLDLAGTVKTAARTGATIDARVIQCASDAALLNGWTKDHFGRPDVDLTVSCDPDLLVAALLQGDQVPHHSQWPEFPERVAVRRAYSGSDIFMSDLADALAASLRGHESSLIRVPLGWHGADLNLSHPLDYLGLDGAGGIGSGPGMAVGAALALQDGDRLAVAVLGDGDFLMGGIALWTAAHYEIPLLVVVANNAYFYNDVIHQERIADQRGRPRANTWIGQAIDNPNPDLAGFARSLGLRGIGQVHDRASLSASLEEAVAAVLDGESVVVDVRVRPDGYEILPN